MTDSLAGGSGADLLEAGRGQDSDLACGVGRDVVSADGGRARVTEDCERWSYTLGNRSATTEIPRTVTGSVLAVAPRCPSRRAERSTRRCGIRVELRAGARGDAVAIRARGAARRGRAVPLLLPVDRALRRAARGVRGTVVRVRLRVEAERSGSSTAQLVLVLRAAVQPDTPR